MSGTLLLRLPPPPRRAPYSATVASHLLLLSASSAPNQQNSRQTTGMVHKNLQTWKTAVAVPKRGERSDDTLQGCFALLCAALLLLLPQKPAFVAARSPISMDFFMRHAPQKMH